MRREPPSRKVQKPKLPERSTDIQRDATQLMRVTKFRKVAKSESDDGKVEKKNAAESEDNQRMLDTKSEHK